jgi:hypothetical protein
VTGVDLGGRRIIKKQSSEIGVPRDAGERKKGQKTGGYKKEEIVPGVDRHYSGGQG